MSLQLDISLFSILCHISIMTYMIVINVHVGRIANLVVENVDWEIY